MLRRGVSTIQTPRLVPYTIITSSPIGRTQAAVNPNGEWSIFFIADPAMVHAKLSLVAMHLADRTTGEITPAQIYHRGQAMRIVERRLAQDPDAVSESTIGAIALLASLDNHSEWSVETRDTHMKALTSLIEARGGIDSTQVSDALRRVVGWVDLLNCAINESKPFLRRSALAVTESQEELFATMGLELKAPLPHIRQQARPLRSIFNILRQLSWLISVNAILSTSPSRKLRVQFSNSLWSLEYEILQLEATGKRAITLGSTTCTPSLQRCSSHLLVLESAHAELHLHIQQVDGKSEKEHRFLTSHFERRRRCYVAR